MVMVQCEPLIEKWDIVDIDHHPIGQTINRDPQATTWLVDHGYYHVVVLGFIICDHHLIVTRRAKGKSAAGYWEVSGGSVLAGESSLDAIQRELKEEIGYSVDSSKIQPLDTYVSNSDLIDPFVIIDDTFKISNMTLQASEVDQIDAIDYSRLNRLIDEHKAVDCLIIFRDHIKTWLKP